MLLSQAPRGRCEAGEQREVESLSDLFGRPDSRVERFPQKRQPEAEDQAKRKPEDPGTKRPWLDLNRSVGPPNKKRVGRLQGFESAELLVLVDQADIERRLVVSAFLELREPRLNFSAST